MKYIVALSWAIVWGIFAVGLRVNSKINTPSFVALLAFALIGGGAIAKYDVLEELTGPGGWGMKARKEINNLKNTAIDEIEKEVELHKHSITLLTKNANQAADQLSQHTASINILIQAAKQAEQKLQKAIEMAAPPTLSLSVQQTRKINEGYESIFGFAPSKNQPLGIIVFQIEVINGAAAKILKFSPVSIVGNMIHKINEDGKKARLQYSSSIQGLQKVRVKVTDTCKLSISGNYIQEPILVDILDEQKQ